VCVFASIDSLSPESSPFGLRLCRSTPVGSIPAGNAYRPVCSKFSCWSDLGKFVREPRQIGPKISCLLYWQMESTSIRLSELKVGVIINTSSGGCDSESEEKMRAKLKGAGVVEPRIWCGGADKMELSFAEAAREKLEVFIVLGGDGTIRTAAQACAGGGRYLIPLPGGTMNMLPQALYGDVSWEDALKNTLVAPSVKVLSGGRVADKQFFVAAVVGAPALWAEARESIRDGNIVDAVEKGSVAFQNMFETKVQYLISDRIKGEAEAITLICPLVSEEMSDSEQALEAAVIDVGSAAEVIGLATAAAFGKWRDNRNIVLTKTQRVGVQSSKNIPATLDGERVNLGSSAEIDFVSKAVNVIVPAK
jgi:diacylglycerol kinase family enzyme